MHKQGFGHTGKRDLPQGELKYQVRINLSNDFARVARANPASALLRPLTHILKQFNAHLKHQEMSFANFLPYFENEEEQTLRDNVQASLDALDSARKIDDIDAEIEALKEFETASETLAERTRLYLWTKATMRKPSTQEKYAKRFTIYAESGQEIYSKETADALIAALEPLRKRGMIEAIDLFDSDPSHNPQPPAKFHR